MFRNLKKRLRDFFGFDNADVNGFLFLFILAVFLLFAPLIYRGISPKPKYDSRRDKELLDSVVQLVKTKQSANKERKDQIVSTKVIKKTELKRKVTSSIGTFDINTADTAQLKMIRGIGSTYASRIIKFRDRLGGFHSLEQLNEVYGISVETVKELKKHTYLGDIEVEKLNVNEVQFKELLQHPYFEYDHVKTLFEARDEVGRINDLNEFQSLTRFDSLFVQKVAPYLNF